MSYKKVGGLHFVRIGRFGFSFFWSRKRLTAGQERKLRARARLEAGLNPYYRPATNDAPLFPYFER